MHHPTDRIAHTTAFVTQVVEHWLEREIAQWVRHEGSLRLYLKWPLVYFVRFAKVKQSGFPDNSDK